MPSAVDPELTNVDPEACQIVCAAVQQWKRRLIDYSRANTLLFFRDLKTGSLDLTAVEDAVQRLLSGQKVSAEMIASSLQKANDQQANAERPAGDLASVRHKLIAIRRKAQSNWEEKGIFTLYLAFEMATWPAGDGGRAYWAPVLLVPARVEMRGSISGDLRLAIDGEPHVNPVLLHVLRDNHRIEVDEEKVWQECGEEDQSGRWSFDPKCVAENLWKQVCANGKDGIRDFRIEHKVVLSNFQFAKMAMVKDLEVNEKMIASSVLVAAVAGHQPSRKSLASGDVLPPEQLDERPIRDSFLVLDADSSQERGIVLASRGCSGVIQGPPGTGKSQTIANLIVQSVAEGRRVLFVAEKRAALEAVVKRLSHPNVGLGHLILDLHGASVSRKEVMARIAEALERIRKTPDVPGVDAVFSEYENLRRELNAHAQRVNQVRPPTNFSVNQMIGRILRLPRQAHTNFRFRGQLLTTLTPERVIEIHHWIEQAGAYARLFLGKDNSPWNRMRIREGSMAQEVLDRATKTVQEVWPKFQHFLNALCRQLQIAPPQDLAGVNRLLGLLREVRSIRQSYPDEIFTCQPGQLAQALEPAACSGFSGWFQSMWAFTCSAPYRAARRRLLQLRKQPAPTRVLHREALLAEDILARWRTIACGDSLPNDGDYYIELNTMFDLLHRFTDYLAALLGRQSLDNVPLSKLGAYLQALAKDRQTPFRLPAIYRLQEQFRQAGLGDFIESLRKDELEPDQWQNRFDYMWLVSALENVLSTDPEFAAFNGQSHDQIVLRFKELDRQLQKLAAQRVARLHALRAIETMNTHFDQTDLVRREANKKARHIPLRDLLSRAPDVLTATAPCWVASPLSVSQLLDGSRRHFDLVIFDEASQIPPEDAIPALYRASQVVVAGDRHQLPPTTFFATVIEGSDESDLNTTSGQENSVSETVGGFESLLDSLQSFLPNWLLQWHYRSEDERLIAFSNRHIYEGRLVTFPSIRDQTPITHVLVEHDAGSPNQEESATREVEEVVKRVIEHAQKRPHESLGVITMGIKHANRIQAALDRELDNYPELADFFSMEREERFFVKNLETVQGDERDAIILSIGYGKTPTGDLPHHFGPLTQDVGYRRLNVAITRTRRRMLVVSSFSSDEVDLSRSGSRGVELLKKYLRYAELCSSANVSNPDQLRQLKECLLWNSQEAGGIVELNSFESDVRAALEEKGIKTIPQLGVSQYRIDLVAMHPNKPGQPVLAIECDGASYHSSPTARDRDRLRQEHLQRLGWRFHRIWSTEWFHHREEEIARTVAAIDEAVRYFDALEAKARQENALAVQVSQEKQTTKPTLTLYNPSDTNAHNHGDDNAGKKCIANTITHNGNTHNDICDSGPQTYDLREPLRKLKRPRIRQCESIDDYTFEELKAIAEWIMSDGLLRTEDEIIEEVFECLPFKNMGRRIKSRLQEVASIVSKELYDKPDGLFGSSDASEPPATG